jgi:Icc-related predicted phosphoesterase
MTIVEKKIVMISDTHARHKQVSVPDGDVLIFAGDLMTCGRKFTEITDFAQWFSAQPHKTKIVIAGNHDRLFQVNPLICSREFSEDVIYLQDTEVIVDGLKYYGSPWQPCFYDWAFNAQRGADIKRYWDLIPEGTDVLVTHGPPYGILDHMSEGYDAFKPLGCEELLKAVERVKPRLHIFGHIHSGYGDDTNGQTIFVNASICDEEYRAVNEPRVITLRKD